MRFTICLIGDGGLTGQILGAHLHGEGVGTAFARLDGRNGAGGLGNAAVFLDGHVGDVHLTGVHHVVNHADLLSLGGDGRGDGAVDFHLHFPSGGAAGGRGGVASGGIAGGGVAFGGVGNGLGEILGLIEQLAVVVIDGILDLEGDLSGLQLLLRHLPRAAPRLTASHGQGRAAKLLNLIAVGIIQRHRAGHVALARVGHGDGDRDGLRFGELGLAQAHGDLQRVVGGHGCAKQAAQGKAHDQPE